MSQEKSGIVLYPEGEVAPNIARQLGVVTNTGHRGATSEIATVHAVAYDPELVIEAAKIFYPDGFDGEYDSPYLVHEHTKLKEYKNILQATAQGYLAREGFGSASDRYLTNGRRFDLIAPVAVAGAELALISVGRDLNVHNYIPTGFDAMAHPWVPDQGTFRSMDSLEVSGGGSVDLLDIRKKIVGSWMVDGRKISPTTMTQQAYAQEEILKITHPYDVSKKEVMPGVVLKSVMTESKDVFTLNFAMPLGDALKKAIEAAHKEYDHEDMENLSDYDAEGDLFGDYRPRPVERTRVHELVAQIDPLDSTGWREGLN